MTCALILLITSGRQVWLRNLPATFIQLLSHIYCLAERPYQKVQSLCAYVQTHRELVAERDRLTKALQETQITLLRKAYGKTSRVQLLTDPTHAIPAQFRSTGLRCLVHGKGASDQLNVSPLPLSTKVHIGDEVVSSGIGGIFPKGIPIGRVVRIEKDVTQSWKQITIEPFVSFERLHHLSLVSPVSND